jgi:ArsR family transcriptional regulator
VDKDSKYDIIATMKVRNYDIMEKHAKLCRIFGHAKRLMIMEFLSDAEKSVSEIAASIGASTSTTSQHLRLLKDNNIVVARRDGQTIYYSLKYVELLKACRLIRKVLLEDMIKSGEAAESLGSKNQVGK